MAALGSKALAQLRKLGQIDNAVKKALTDEGEAVLGTSKRHYVPVITGALRDSGFVERPKKLYRGWRIRVGFGGPSAKYALKVHENPRAGRTGGIGPKGQRYPFKKWSRVGQWKYLEVPVNLAKPGMPARLARRLQRYTRRALI